MNAIQLFKPNRLTFHNLKGDIFGGITAGIVALPLALGFGVASGVENGALAGLYGAIIVGFMASCFGGTPAQVSGPTGPMTVVVADVMVSHGLNSESIFDAVLLAGVIQILFGWWGIGNYIHYIPKPAVSGFMTGIGVIIIVLQIQPLLGLPALSGPQAAIAHAWESIRQLNPTALVLGVSTIAIVYLTPRIQKDIPGTLVALIIGTAATWLLGLEVTTIGDIPVGLPDLKLAFPNPEKLDQILFPALTLAALGSLDSLLTSVVADNITDVKHDSKKELIGQGIGNALAGLVGGLPGAGATMRTVVNIEAGGKTPLSGIIHSILLAAILLGAAPLAEHIPRPVLAGILFTVGLNIIDYQGLKHLPNAPKADKIVLLVVLTLTIFVDLITAVAAGFLIACVLFIEDLSKMELTQKHNLLDSENTRKWADEAGLPQEFRDQVHVYHAQGPFFFGTSEAFINALEGHHKNLKAVIVRMKDVPLIDQTGAYALGELLERMHQDGIAVAVCCLRKEPMQILTSMGIIPDLLPKEWIFSDFESAVKAVSIRLLNHQNSKTHQRPQDTQQKIKEIS